GQLGEKRVPCWNPVLFQPKKGDLVLYYKAGHSPKSWWGEYKTSADGGKTWSPPRRLTEGFLGPIKDKPVELADGTLLCGSSMEPAAGPVHRAPRTQNAQWQKTGPLNDGKKPAAIQPTILRHGKRLQILCRTRQGAIAESWSDDGGRTWTELKPTALPNPNSGI